jgi:3-hydroxybutyryl-CoA dehydratase
VRRPRQLAVGARSAPCRVGPITQTDVVRFAGAGGDFNPLHHDPGFAAAAGFRSVIAMGQLQAGILASYLSDWVGVEHLREYEVRFVAPVFLGDTLELSAEVVSIEDGVARLELSASVADHPVVRAQACAVVEKVSPPDPSSLPAD